MKQLEEKLKIYETEKRKSYNTMEDVEATVKKNFRQGNTGKESVNPADDRNTMKRVKLNIDGDFRQGDDIV